MIPLGQHPLPRYAVAHLSDPHLLAEGLMFDSIDVEANLRSALARLGDLELPPQAIVLTGDLADRAEPKAYRRLREVVEPAAAALGAQVVWVMGNHDDRAAYALELYGEAAADGPRDRVHHLGGLRVVALDTSVPGYHHGELSEDQLAWLADVLASPAEHGTLLAMHHPPIPVPLQRVAALIELHDQDRLAAVVAGSDVRGILGGHFHYTSWGTFAGVPVSVASATCYVDDPAPGDRFVRGVDGHQALTMLHVYDDRIVHTVVPVPRAREVSGLPLSAAARLEALAAADRHDLVSRTDSPLWSGELTLD